MGSHDIQKHVFQIGFANFHVFGDQTGAAHRCQIVFDLRRIIRRKLHDAAAGGRIAAHHLHRERRLSFGHHLQAVPGPQLLGGPRQAQPMARPARPGLEHQQLHRTAAGPPRLQPGLQHPGVVHLLERSGKLGLGTAYITGFKWGIERGYDFIFEMDCDFSHNPKDLIRLKETLVNGADLVVGSRYVKGGKCVNWPADRKILSYGASLYVRMITWMWIKDPTAGFVGYRRKVLETIDLDMIKFIGYAFQIEMKFAAKVLGFKLKEIPITFTDRIEGTSKMSKGIVKEAVWGVLQMKWMSFTGSFKRKEKWNFAAKNQTSQRSN